MNGKIEQGLHEKLCAYVLGEIDGADRAEVERELLRSPELRAERERLESTIGAVREALMPAQALTPAAKEALERAVRPAPIAQFPWLRLAAGIGAVGLGWWIFARVPQRQAEVLVERLEQVDESKEEAEIDRAVAMIAPNASPEQREQMRAVVRRYDGDAKAKADQAAGALSSLGYTGEEKLAEIQVRPLAKDAGSRTGVELGQAAKGLDGSGQPEFRGEFLVDGLNKLLTPQPVTPLAPSTPTQTPPLDVGFTSRPKVEAVELTTTNRMAGAAGTTAGATAAPTETLMIQDSARWREVSARKPLEFTALGEGKRTSQGGSYRGPGDSVVPGGGGKAPTSSTGPSTPGPLAPGLLVKSASGSGNSSTDGSDFFTGLGESSKARDAEDARKEELKRQLAANGYASDDGDDASKARRQNRPWNELTPVEQAQQIELRYGTIVQGCFPRPNERPRDMFFRFWGDNPFEVTMLDKLSTFSVDVDTASYALARRYLDEGRVPEKAQVRTEEFVNYFPSDVEAPRNATFSVHSDLTPSRFSADSARQMLRVVVRAKDVDKTERQPMHLTFVLDVSGSMKEQNRLETVKHALRMLVAQLDARDSIALVKFSNDASLVLPMTSVVDRATIEAAIAPLVPEGSTNSNAGLQLGYAQALTGLDPNAVNRVVFLSDGVANVGETDAAKILEGVQSIREKGIFLNTIGVGMNNHNDVLLEQLADKGDGLCNYVDSPKEIQRALVDRFTGAFQPIAKDVKIQVEFDPQQVMRYRLLGYENRAIADADFRNDAVDAGELGAGHQVTALYEIEPTGRAGDGPMATVRLRWKPIRAAGTSGVQEATEASFDVSARSYQAFESSPPGHRRALIVAQFAEILRRSIHARGESLDDLIAEAGRLQAQIPNDKDFAEFTALLLRAKDSILRTMPACDEMCQTIDALRSNQYLGAVMGESRQDANTLQEIEATRRKLEERLRELLRQQAAGGDLQKLGYTDGKK